MTITSKPSPSARWPARASLQVGELYAFSTSRSARGGSSNPPHSAGRQAVVARDPVGASRSLLTSPWGWRKLIGCSVTFGRFFPSALLRASCYARNDSQRFDEGLNGSETIRAAQRGGSGLDA
jgi:hypothetical protein